nr:pectinesterase 2.1-like [Ipomoea batatas]
MATCNLQPLLGISPTTPVFRWKTILQFLLITTLSSSSFSLSDISPSRLCRTAIDPDACETILKQTVPSYGGNTIRTPADLLRKFLADYLPSMEAATVEFGKVRGELNHPREIQAIADCVELMEFSINEVQDTIKIKNLRRRHADAQTSLSAVLTNHLTCLDGLDPPEKSPAKDVLDALISKSRVALAVLAEIIGQTDFQVPFKGKFPSWVKSSDRKLVRRNPGDLKADIVVSQNGKGNFKTLTEAMKSVSKVRKNRVIIYVMKGLYKENVDMNAKSPVMIYGDGMTQTVFTGDHSFGDNYTTYNSYTLAAKGPGVILQDLCVRNTAGAAKHQAVALMVGGDKSIINRCFLDGYQDTLYTHSKRQFYRDCTVTGTIDFVFGDAAVVLQNCTLVAKKPGKAQQNMVTAQGRADPNQNTGISLHLCNLTPSPKLKPVIDRFPTFLGRPWRNFARTMVMESYIGAHINPAGWHEWSGTVFLDTLWFGEFSNHGPGSATKSRVKWSTFHAISDRSVASKFTVSGLLQDDKEKWVIQSGVDCMEGLLPPRKINQTNVNVS